MKQINIKPQEAEIPETESSCDVVISALSLEKECPGDDPKTRQEKLVTYLKTVIAEREQLLSMIQKLESDPRMVKFIERLISGDSGDVAFETAGLKTLIDDTTDEEVTNENVDISKEVADFYQEKGVAKEVVDEFILFVETFIGQVYEKEIGRTVLDVLWLAFMYENDVRKSYDEGLIKGQNKKIESLRFERKNVDGLGAIGGGAMSMPQTKKVGYIEGLLNK
ncbi:MAG: hypothetical protein RSF94_06050 [Rikenellaceae bacterium]